MLDVPGQGQIRLGETVSLSGADEVFAADPVVDGLAVPAACLGRANEVFAAN